jgi:hypothetical protein
MKLLDLYQRIKPLLKEFFDYDVVATEVKSVDDFIIRVDSPIFDMGISVEHQKEIILLTKWDENVGKNDQETSGIIGFVGPFEDEE